MRRSQAWTLGQSSFFLQPRLSLNGLQKDLPFLSVVAVISLFGLLRWGAPSRSDLGDLPTFASKSPPVASLPSASVGKGSDADFKFILVEIGTALSCAASALFAFGLPFLHHLAS